MDVPASFPADLLYHPEPDWARVDGDLAPLGVTWFGQNALGEIVFCDLPEAGREVAAGEPYAELESVKAVSAVVAPLSGASDLMRQHIEKSAENVIDASDTTGAESSS
jgi:glycine cleavage system H protein